MPPEPAPTLGAPTEIPVPVLSGSGDFLVAILLITLVVAVAWYSHVYLVLPPVLRARGLSRRGVSPTTRTEEAARLLYRLSGRICPPRTLLTSQEEYHAAYRRAAARLHPDVSGNSERFYELQEVKGILDAHHADRERTSPGASGSSPGASGSSPGASGSSPEAP